MISKTHSIELVTIHLATQTDPKSLIGSYISAAQPGSFKWVPGLLVTALKRGCWLLIEDIDLAPSNVISLLIPILETKSLFIPSRAERIDAHPNFRIFATRTISKTKSNVSIRNASIENLWFKVDLPEFEELKMREIVMSTYPGLESHVERLFSVYKALLSYAEKDRNALRHVNFRELLKFAKRIHLMISTADSIPQHVLLEDTLREAFDTFLAYIPEPTLRAKLCILVAESIAVPEYRAHYFLENYVPPVQIGDELIKIGRFSKTVDVSISKKRRTGM